MGLNELYPRVIKELVELIPVFAHLFQQSLQGFRWPPKSCRHLIRHFKKVGATLRLHFCPLAYETLTVFLRV